MSTFARTPSGDLQLPRVLVTDPAQVARQTIIDRLSLWQGEWFLDTTSGFPWFQQVLGRKAPNVTRIVKLLRQALLDVPGVVAVAASVAINRQLRTFGYSFVASLDSGVRITGGTGVPTAITGSP